MARVHRQQLIHTPESALLDSHLVELGNRKVRMGLGSAGKRRGLAESASAPTLPLIRSPVRKGKPPLAHVLAPARP